MAKPEFIARQSAHPTGWFGHVVARVMALDTARVNRRLLDRLEPKPGERILEIGCGHGRALRKVAERVAPGFVAGVDPSAVMRRVARSHLRRAIAAGEAEVEPGTAAQLPYRDGAFDKAFSVHTLYFWHDLAAGLAEIHRVLRPDGTLLLVFHDGSDPAMAAELPESVYRLHSGEEVATALATAGFHDVSIGLDAATGVTVAAARR